MLKDDMIVDGWSGVQAIAFIICILILFGPLLYAMWSSP